MLINSCWYGKSGHKRAGKDKKQKREKNKPLLSRYNKYMSGVFDPNSGHMLYPILGGHDSLEAGDDHTDDRIKSGITKRKPI
ncbi:MAG: hypothetical protein K2M63_09610 [Muribaculaceae bacterium]|nr:hypothetical protein [Muribaculaceae bacterium]